MSSGLGIVLSFAKLDGLERPVAVLLSAGPLPEKTIVERLGQIQDAVKTTRAVVRLLRDGMIAAVRGLLSLTPWSVWPPNRLKPEDAQKLEQLIPWKDDPQPNVDDRTVVLRADTPAPDRDAERLEKILDRASVVFGEETVQEIRADHASILSSTGGLKRLMAAVLSAESLSKPPDNPIGWLIAVGRKLHRTGIPDALWDKLAVRANAHRIQATAVPDASGGLLDEPVSTPNSRDRGRGSPTVDGDAKTLTRRSER